MTVAKATGANPQANFTLPLCIEGVCGQDYFNGIFGDLQGTGFLCTLWSVSCLYLKKQNKKNSSHTHNKEWRREQNRNSSSKLMFWALDTELIFLPGSGMAPISTLMVYKWGGGEGPHHLPAGSESLLWRHDDCGRKWFPTSVSCVIIIAGILVARASRQFGRWLCPTGNKQTNTSR